MSMRRLSFVLFGILGLALLCTAAIDRVWIGSFPLTIGFISKEPFDTTDLVFATCIDQTDVDAVMETGTPMRGKIVPSVRVEEMTYRIAVSCTGRSNLLGIGEDYHQPKFVVVGYSHHEAGVRSLSWKPSEIPLGRGPRTLQMSLP